MQRFLALVLSFVVLLSLVSCANNNPSLSSSNTDLSSVESGSTQSQTTSDFNSSSNTQSNLTSSKPNRPASSSDISSNTTTSNNSPTNTSPGSTTSLNATSSDVTSSGQTLVPSVPTAPIPCESYFCYSNLTVNQKSIYNALYTAGTNMETLWIEINLQSAVKFRDVSLAFFALETDHPELFWLPTQYYVKIAKNKVQFLFVGDDSSSLPQNSTYLIKRSEKEEMSKKLNAAVAEIKALVTATDPYEIELQLHDILCDRITYGNPEVKDPMLWTAYGALVNKTAVCEGYARAFQLLLYEFGINSTLATGIAGGEGHMWNIVNINGENYHVDVTWDDREDGGSPSFHAFFNLSDSEISPTHNMHPDFSLIKDSVFDSGEAVNYNFSLPKCTDTSLNYFTVTGVTFNAGNEEAIADYIIEVGGNIEFKFVGSEPDLTKINSFLIKKRSKLKVVSSIKKPTADVLILQVERVM